MGINISNYSSGATQLNDAAENLEIAWHRVKEDWHDDNSLHFEENYLLPILQEIKIAVQSIQTFSNVLHQAERTCNPENESEHYF